MRRVGSGPQGGAATRATRGLDPGHRTDTPTHEHPHPPRRAPRDPGARQSQARGAQTNRHGGARTQRGTAARRHASPEGARTRTSTRAPAGRPAPPRPVTFMSLTMAWKSPPRAPHSFSAVSMLGPGGSVGGGAQAGRGDPGRGGFRSEARSGLQPPGCAQRPAAPRSGIAGRRGAARAMSRRGWRAARGLERRP